jgi:excisionase family DNA binding protein
LKTAKGTTTPLIFTTYDIGRMTGTDPTTVHKWIDKGLLRGYRTPGGHRRVRAEDLRGFLSAHGMPMPKELGGAESLRVMVVDAEAESLRSTARTLRRLKPGWDVVCAESGVDALLRFACGTPDVLVYDLAVPDTDGYSLFRQLHDRSETSAVKLVAVAVRPGPDVERKATAAGASACLKKPLGGEDLVTAIELAAGLRPAVGLS